MTRSSGQKANYQGAIDAWLIQHGQRTIFCLVQFKGVALDEMPRVYLATPTEIALRLKETAGGRGDTILYEEHEWGSRAHGAGFVERIPANWRLSPERLDQLFTSVGGRV